MSRPEDIPQDVWVAAELEVRRWPLDTDCVVGVARAILAERERCVKWVADHQTRSNGDPLDPSMPDILYAIRAGATHG